MQDVSEEMVRVMFSSDASPPVVLVTIYGGGLDAPIYASSDPDGTFSRGEEYPFFPFTFSAGGSTSDETAPGCRLQIGNVDGRITDAVRAATGKPSATIEVVRQAAPDDVELAISAALIDDVDIDDTAATASISPRSFANEPAVAPRYVIFRTPGLFANTIDG